jgi:hypothetical protein
MNRVLLSMNVDGFISSAPTSDDHKTQLKIMLFVHNAIMDGWTVKHRHGEYIFKRKHHSRKKVFSDEYLSRFVENNATIN